MTSLAIRPTPAAAGLGTGAETAEAETARLFEEHSERILAFCLRRLGSRSEAEDAVQMTFLYALRALRRGVVPDTESAWLHAIAKNVCRWQRRTLSRRGPLSGYHDVDEVAGPERDHAEDDELCRDLREALVSLPANQRRALVLRELHGLSSSEVAARMGMSAPATYALLTRARQSFVQAFTALRHPVQGLGWLAFEVRALVKALLGGASAKAAVAGVAIVGAGVGGYVADQGLGEPVTPTGPAPTSALSAGAQEPVSTASTVAERASATSGGNRRTAAETSSQQSRQATIDRRRPGQGSATLLVPRRTPGVDGPKSDPQGGGEPTTPKTTPAEQPKGSLPESSLTETELLPPELLPSVDPPSVDLPPVDLPPVDVPALEPLPELDVPTVDLPPVDVPPVDLPPVDLPPLFP